MTATGNDLVTYWSTDNAGNGEAANAVSFTCRPAADHLAFDASPAQVTAGGKFDLTVYAEMPSNAIDTNYQGTKRLRSLAAPAVVSQA